MAVLRNDDQIAQLKRSLPVLFSSDAYKCIPIAVGSTGAYGTTGAVDVTLANVVATDTVVVSKLADDTTGAGTMKAVAGAGKITITLSEVTTGDADVAYVVYRA